MHLVIIFVAGFASVFLLGFQSRAVNHGNYKLAAGNSFLIAIMQTTLWGALFKDLSWASTIAYGFGAMLGVVSSMIVHQKLMVRWRKPEN